MASFGPAPRSGPLAVYEPKHHSRLNRCRDVAVGSPWLAQLSWGASGSHWRLRRRRRGGRNKRARTCWSEQKKPAEKFGVGEQSRPAARPQCPVGVLLTCLQSAVGRRMETGRARPAFSPDSKARPGLSTGCGMHSSTPAGSCRCLDAMALFRPPFAIRVVGSRMDRGCRKSLAFPFRSQQAVVGHCSRAGTISHRAQHRATAPRSFWPPGSSLAAARAGAGSRSRTFSGRAAEDSE
jgi:hypothetical protein